MVRIKSIVLKAMMLLLLLLLWFPHIEAFSSSRSSFSPYQSERGRGGLTSQLFLSTSNDQKKPVLDLPKTRFLQEVKRQKPLSFPDPTYLDSLLQQVLQNTPYTSPCDPTTLQRLSTGTWKVVYAPHINLLEKLLFTTFSVYYIFPSKYDKSSINRDGSVPLTSFAYYESPVYGNGHLNTAGKVLSQSENTCSVIWEKIWWDRETPENGPSLASETDKHILPRVIQALGEKGFIREVSTFPVSYLDEDLCVFDFMLTGTRIAAIRQL